jgi:hypothetical protein
MAKPRSSLLQGKALHGRRCFGSPDGHKYYDNVLLMHMQLTNNDEAACKSHRPRNCFGTIQWSAGSFGAASRAAIERRTFGLSMAVDVRLLF